VRRREPVDVPDAVSAILSNLPGRPDFSPIEFDPKTFENPYRSEQNPEGADIPPASAFRTAILPAWEWGFGEEVQVLRLVRTPIPTPIRNELGRSWYGNSGQIGSEPIQQITPVRIAERLADPRILPKMFEHSVLDGRTGDDRLEWH
jgi:hypothetical protein